MRKYPFKNNFNVPRPKENHQGIIIKDVFIFKDHDSCGQEYEKRIEHMIEFNIDILFECFPELKENIEDDYRGELINKFLEKICSSIYTIDIKEIK